jgi:hypothetical protein
MKITTEEKVKDFILDRVNLAILTFDDDTEIKLTEITDIDIDLNKLEISYINFTNALHNVELENCFSKNKKITHVYLETRSFLVDCTDLKVFYDIQCDMRINRLRINIPSNDVDDMYVELEGFVK